jgi:hypothetical protein
MAEQALRELVSGGPMGGQPAGQSYLPKIRKIQVDVAGIETDVVIMVFVNRVLVMITQTGKFGTWVWILVLDCFFQWLTSDVGVSFSSFRPRAKPRRRATNAASE